MTNTCHDTIRWLKLKQEIIQNNLIWNYFQIITVITVCYLKLKKQEFYYREKQIEIGCLDNLGTCVIVTQLIYGGGSYLSIHKLYVMYNMFYIWYMVCVYVFSLLVIQTFSMMLCLLCRCWNGWHSALCICIFISHFSNTFFYAVVSLVCFSSGLHTNDSMCNDYLSCWMYMTWGCIYLSCKLNYHLILIQEFTVKLLEPKQIIKSLVSWRFRAVSFELKCSKDACHFARLFLNVVTIIIIVLWLVNYISGSRFSLNENIMAIQLWWLYTWY